jgi:antitoxin component YwqK of YwqJK toxin-antitoxin module
MKKRASLLLLVMASCQQATYEPDYVPVVEEQYVHKYGFEVSPQEWQNRGEHGQKITTLKNGVTVKQSYSFGQLDGESTYTYPYSSTINLVERYQEGKLIQDEERNQSGVPTKKREFLGNITRITVWYQGGHPQAIEEYENDILMKGDYLTLQGATESQVVEKNGERINRDLQGNLVSKDTIVNGRLQERIVFWDNGTPKESIPYNKSGLVNGHRKTFLRDGEPASDETWENGVQNGLTVTYNNGEKFAEVPYRNGVKSGVERRYRDGSELFEQVSWIDGSLVH